MCLDLRRQAPERLNPMALDFFCTVPAACRRDCPVLPIRIRMYPAMIAAGGIAANSAASVPPPPSGTEYYRNS